MLDSIRDFIAASMPLFYAAFFDAYMPHAMPLHLSEIMLCCRLLLFRHERRAFIERWIIDERC